MPKKKDRRYNSKPIAPTDKYKWPRKPVIKSAPSVLAINIQNRREELGLSRGKLAELVGMPKNGLLRLELGYYHDMLTARAQQIAHVLGVTVDWLLASHHPGESFEDAEQLEEIAVAD